MKTMMFVGVLSVLLPQLILASDVMIDTDNVIAEVEPFFISFAMDAYIIEEKPRWMNFDFKSTKLRTLMTGLSPALLRFGGSPADWTVFADDLSAQGHANMSGIEPVQSIMTRDDIDNLVNLTRDTGNRFLFDLDLQLRYGEQWDPTNAIQLMQYMESQKYGDNIDFELGNEPGCYHTQNQGHFSAAQIGKDFLSLTRLVKSFSNLKQSMVVGPDVVKLDSVGTAIIKSVVEQAGADLKAATFHHYYFRGDIAHVKDYIDPSHFANLPDAIGVVKRAIGETSHPDTTIWIGETADAWHSGTVNVSDRYVSGFLWMDKLGVSAREGVRVVIRQTLYGHNYGLIDVDLTPNPDYWLSLMHKHLVGTKVLKVTSQKVVNTTRVYAQCTQQKGWTTFPKGSVTIFALNINPNTSDTIHVDIGKRIGQKVMAFYMTPPNMDILSKSVMVNGQVLKMVDNSTLPVVKAKTMDLANGITLQPLTFGFFVLPNAGAKACM